ncbi:seleno protein W-like protein [Exophiala viscosa]|uniref:Seleno protein W-like protein n=2 Tax=Exophiala viscosa TaxID=2486360 RepID=A0AAN6IIL8_9EURO|nr:seleno protein W-like protein [Exophiala viscosa]
MTHAAAPTAPDSESPSSVTDTVLWDRKTENGFPETKELKNRVRNIIEPDRDLGHIDRRLKKDKEAQAGSGAGDPSVAKMHGDSNGQQIAVGEGKASEQKECEDCK